MSPGARAQILARVARLATRADAMSYRQEVQKKRAAWHRTLLRASGWRPLFRGVGCESWLRIVDGDGRCLSETAVTSCRFSRNI